jgi:hypothetical protein
MNPMRQSLTPALHPSEGEREKVPQFRWETNFMKDTQQQVRKRFSFENLTRSFAPPSCPLTTMVSVEHFESRIKALNERLRPIAEKRVDITQPGWIDRLKESPHPLDRAGVRTEFDALLPQIIAVYSAAGEETRVKFRELFRSYRAFSWAASLPFSPNTEEHFRMHLLLFAIKDQERDSRDALVLLQDLCRQAKVTGIRTQPILSEVAGLCSSENRFGMGSTKDMLLRMC